MSSSATSIQIPNVQIQPSQNVAYNQANIERISNASSLQKKPIYMEKFRQISFGVLPFFPHPISFDLRDKVVKFSGNNVVTGEEHFRVS